MKPIQALSATLAIVTTVAATAAVPAPQAAAPGATRSATRDGAPQAAAANPSGDARALALWTYCGMYTRPDGRTGIKCYTV